MKLESTNENDQRVNYWPWVSVFLAVSPVIGYFAAYLYESEFFKYFGIPLQFMVLDWANLIVGMISVLTFSYFLLVAISLPKILQYARIKTGILMNEFIWLGSLLLFVTLYILRYSLIFPYLWILYILPFYFAIQEFLIPIILQRKTDGFRAKLVEQKRLDNKKIRENNPRWMLKYGSIIAFSMITFVIICMTAMGEGRLNAVTKDEFLVLSNDPSSVVLKAYKDYLICAPFNADNRTIVKDFTIIPITQPSGITLRLEKLGQLKPQ